MPFLQKSYCKIQKKRNIFNTIHTVNPQIRKMASVARLITSTGTRTILVSLLSSTRNLFNIFMTSNLKVWNLSTQNFEKNIHVELKRPPTVQVHLKPVFNIFDFVTC